MASRNAGDLPPSEVWVQVMVSGLGVTICVGFRDV